LPEKGSSKNTIQKELRTTIDKRARHGVSAQGLGADMINGLTSTLAGFKNRLVLEVSVGSGRSALPLLANIVPQLVGLDLSQEMLQQAKLKAKSFKKNLVFIQADAEQLPFIRDIFDWTVFMSMMHYFSSTEKILRTFTMSKRLTRV
jgi:ubiquinone/menaquinone biosynthesis C-methylase UbiE